MTWSRDGKRLVTADGERGTPGRVWDASTGRQISSLAGHSDGNLALATSPDGSLFATSGSRVKRDTGDVSVRLWSSVDGREVAALQPKLAASDLGIRQLWFSTDGKTLFGTARESLYVWDVEKNIETHSLAIPFNAVNSVHPIAGGRNVLMSGWLPRPNSEFTSTSHPLVLATIDLETGKEIGRREEFGQDRLAAVSPDGRFAVRMQFRSTRDHSADVWDLTTGRTTWRLNESAGKRNTPSVRCATFATDMRTLSIGMSDGSIRVLEMATRSERLRFSHGASIQGLAYSPDGTRLATTGSRWGMVWDLNPQSTKPLSEADAWAGLASNDARVGLASIRQYADHPDQAVRRISTGVQPVAMPDRRSSLRGSSNSGRTISRNARRRTGNSRLSPRRRGSNSWLHSRKPSLPRFATDWSESSPRQEMNELWSVINFVPCGPWRFWNPSALRARRNS
jgi:WD40 repeat protein